MTTARRSSGSARSPLLIVISRCSVPTWSATSRAKGASREPRHPSPSAWNPSASSKSTTNVRARWPRSARRGPARAVSALESSPPDSSTHCGTSA